MRNAISKAQDQVARMFACRRCGKPQVEMATAWRSRSTGSGKTLHLATDFEGDPAKVCQCLPEGVAPYSWPCVGCGAYVAHQVDQCPLCGYARRPCPTCNGTGAVDVGAPVWFGSQPCYNCDDGSYYPPVLGVAR